MARMPGAVWLGEQSPRNPMSRYDIVCVHTIVGFAPAHAAHFSVKLDGTIQQSRDTAFQSAANLHGNPRVIAIENEDGGKWWEPLTPEQVASNARIFRWAHETHGIPLQLCPDSRPGSRGLAYHRQGIDGNFGDMRFPGRVSGGEVWTEHFGKVCPGDNKIAQRPDILALALNQGDDDMQLSDEYADGKKVGALFRQLDRFIDNEVKRDRETVAELKQIEAGFARSEQVDRLRERVANLRARLEAEQADDPTEG